MVPTAHHPPLRSVFTEYSGDSGSQQGTLDGTCDENGLRRQKSVRFAKSSKNDAANGTGIPRRRSVLGRIENQQNCAAAQKTDESPCFNPFTAKFVESLPPAESYRPVDECASVPGSYRKLRKSRSMFSPTGQTPTPKYYFSNSPEQGNPTPALRRKSMQNIKESKSPKRNRSLRAPKSMSFLKSTGTRSNLRTNASEGESSGNKFGGDGQAPLQSRTSRLFTSNKEGIRQSMRDPSAGNLAVPKRNGSLRKKARKVSSGFKTRLKSFFGLTKNDGQEPEGKMDSQAGVGSHDEGDRDIDEDAYMDIDDPVLDECSISQVPSRVPSLHASSSAQQLRSRQGSIESIESLRKVSDDQSDERSRVTSWTSSGTHTLNSQSTWGGERDRQRLSVIKENGPHYSSSSFRRPTIDERSPYEFEVVSPEKPSGPPAPPAVDSQRVYSALMNRLYEVNQKENMREASGEDFQMQEAKKLRRSLDDSPPTIRCVRPEDDVFRDGPPTQIPPVGIAETTEDGSFSESGSVIHYPTRTAPTGAHYSPYPGPAVGDEKTVLPVTVREVSAAPKTLSTRSSAFFGSPTCHLFRTTSPYRRALQKSMKESSSESSAPPELNLDLVSTRRHPSLSGDDPRLAYSDSIYSDQPMSPRLLSPQLLSSELLTSALVAPGAIRPRRPSVESSSRTNGLTHSKSCYSDITERAANTSTRSGSHGRSRSHTPCEPLTYVPTMPTDTEARTASYASSVEWKTYLSANASNSDIHAPVRQMMEVRYAKPSMPKGHVREGAQMYAEDEPKLYKPAGPVKFHTPLRTMSHNRQASSASRAEGAVPPKVSALYSNENAIPYSEGRVNGHIRVYGPPPIPPRSSLREIPSMPLLQSRSSQSNIPVKSPNRATLKVRSSDTMPDFTSAETKPKTRSPMKLVRRVGLRKSLKPSVSSPGLGMTVEKQFGPMLGSDQVNQGSPRERRQSGSGRRLLDSSDFNSTDTSDTTSSDDWRAQKLGSQQMVENFLSDRHQAMVRSEHSRAFL
ncbi:hypothetical protein CGCA056_v011990 [Colletotrichum aenigma]|uniref:uncharacterized protein n=1 Tax=Colletotrichum aenigma TaxID=1215731 RepID=UPI001873067F|nr:uncharacterized protein CGCA056_v011990 [Colletotrichum aenigma]KAF5512178.1 hypothetical protein CGCA056_v011990 [Colletotrichum aenigma]